MRMWLNPRLTLLLVIGLCVPLAAGRAQEKKTDSTRLLHGGEKVIMDSFRNVGVVSWSPIGKNLIYAMWDEKTNELWEWPSARRTKIPFLGRVKWRRDGKEVALIERSAGPRVCVVDMTAFKVRRVLKKAYPIWWSRKELCYALPIQERRRDKRQAWYYGEHKHYTPRGLSILEASADGSIVLVAIATRTGMKESLMKLNPSSGKFSRMRFVPTRIGDGSDYHDNDVVTIAWNDKKRAAALVYIPSWIWFGYLAVEAKGKSFDFAVPAFSVYPDDDPKWVDDKILVTARLWMEYDRPYGHVVESWYRLMLWDPWHGTVETLTNSGGPFVTKANEPWPKPTGIGSACVSPDGKWIAYSWRENRNERNKLIIAEYSDFLKKSREKWGQLAAEDAKRLRAN